MAWNMREQTLLAQLGEIVLIAKKSRYASRVHEHVVADDRRHAAELPLGQSDRQPFDDVSRRDLVEESAP
jgi:hypothetical protein